MIKRYLVVSIYDSSFRFVKDFDDLEEAKRYAGDYYIVMENMHV